MPQEFCSFRDKPDCIGKITYRTATGLCNNLENPYEGNSHTAYGRLKPADYSDRMLNNRISF